MNPEKLAKLQASAASVRIGGKGSQRRKKKFVHRSSTTDDKKLQKEAAARKTEPSAASTSASEPCCKEPPPQWEPPKTQRATAATLTELTHILADCCKVSTASVTASVTVDKKEDVAEICGESGGRSILGSKIPFGPPGGTIIIRSDIDIKDDAGILEFMKWMVKETGIKTIHFKEWHGLKFCTINPLINLEIVLNSGIKYEKTHGLRARCTVFFTRVDKDLLVKIKNETENENLRKKAAEKSGVTIEDVRHIGLGRTIRVHCRTPTGAETIIKNGLSIGGITLHKGKLEELKPITQCTHCWKLGHKIGNCAVSRSKEPPICGTCGKTGHRRKDCPTPNEPKCVLCDGKHSSSAGRCLVRQAKIKSLDSKKNM